MVLQKSQDKDIVSVSHFKRDVVQNDTLGKCPSMTENCNWHQLCRTLCLSLKEKFPQIICADWVNGG